MACDYNICSRTVFFITFSSPRDSILKSICSVCNGIHSRLAPLDNRSLADTSMAVIGADQKVPDARQ